ncbi:gliding motility-associated C-terminal domain-containing protein [Myroides ceti]|uniref:Gliding motility-associated C-terminal domain-containing protein n=1 Tax=Paenimyroides ceti TaxID=395087 RepID=A0ABT8CXD0_9FLAO|nr:gliding motility-associated C-terminal domain-containing protein [Paenimyroides ceti]MDN3708776.1 gliding motility-associated C-terminal domain-containing protein [Paenimyroides ceti]
MKKLSLFALFLCGFFAYSFAFEQNIYEDIKGFVKNVFYVNGQSGTQAQDASIFYLNPADLNFSEDFEGSPTWDFSNGTQPNKWYIGTAVNNGGTQSLYISDNNGTSNNYTTSTSSVTQAYKQISIPANIADVQIKFDWRALGETGVYDYLRVWIVPVTFTPTAGNQIATGGGRIRIGGDLYQQSSWTTFNAVANLSSFAGQDVRLVFEWRNDASAGTQPPAAIDNILVKGVTCSAPSNLVITTLEANMAQISWTGPATTNVASYDYYYATTATPPVTPSGNVTGTTVTIENLTPSTQYYFWVRSNCGATDGSSFWIGPLQATTTQIPAPVNFNEGFEGDSSGWTFTNGTQTNKWIIGSAVANGGTKSLYITNDNGTSNAYTNSSSTTTHAIRDLAFPVGASEATISFDWRALGETGIYDYMRVWLVPVTFTPVSGTLITEANSGGVQIGGNFFQQANWQNYNQIIDVNAYAGQTRRLIFEWRNDGSGGNQPPAAVDNVNINLITCPRPIDIHVQKNNLGNMVISWQPTGSETQWEIIIQPAADPPPTDATTGIIVNGTPQYIYTQAQEGVIYKVYIRAVCSDSDKSLWTNPIEFSDFNPPACADLNVLPLDLNVNENGEYIFCEAEGEVTIDLDASFDAESFKSTSEYVVESIDYEPPFPFLGGTVMPITSDDDYTASFNLPFNFCFFENSYSFCRIGDNGVITFGLPFTTTYGEFCPWNLQGVQIPNTNFAIKNAIYGVFQDMHTTNNPGPNSQINYQILGTYPCRALVVNFNEVPAFGTGSNDCTDPQYRTTTQIVLYEITNIIEVYVKKRTACLNWPTGANAGQGVLGIQNAAGTLAYTPPGRNTGSWSTTEEAWRFKPNGETNVTFGWYANGALISTDPQHQITISETTNFEARISYPGCGDEDFEIVKAFTVKVSEEVIATQAENIELCVFQGEIPEVNLRDKDSEVLAQIENTTNFEVNYYETAEDAEADTARLANPENYQPNMLPKVIYVRVENTDTECYATTSFRIVPKEAIKITKPDDIIVCVYDGIIPEVNLQQVEQKLMSQIADPQVHTVSYHHTQNEAILNANPITNIGNYQAGTLPETIYVRLSNNETQCEATTSFRIIQGEVLDTFVIDDVLICTNYVLPELPQGYYYSTQDIGKGDVLKPGEVYGLGQHKVYINIDSKDGCVATSELNFEVVDCSIPKGISPNGDGLNDNFDLTLYHALQVVIYNRDGREVFSYGQGYTNQWYGQDKSGKELPDGTYFYKITTATEVLSGYVQVVREIK